MEFLHVGKGKILDGSSQAVRLRGTCVGGWMNMENFINGYPGTESGIREAVAHELGAAKSEVFFGSMLDRILGEDDIRFIRECGANAVRLPLNYRHFEDDRQPFRYREAGFRRLDRMLDICEKNGVYAILDLHSVPGWQNTDWHCDNDTGHTLFWEHPHFQERYVALWGQLASRYRDRAVVAGYDVMNEPLCNAWRGMTGIKQYACDWDKINGIYRRVVSAIREVDARHIIFLEGDYFASLFDGLDAPFDDNLAYSSHNYVGAGFGPGAYPGMVKGVKWDREKQEETFRTHSGTVFTQRHRVPLWVGEFGAVYNGPEREISDRLRALQDQIGVFEQYDAHWTTWTYKDVGVMGWAMLDPRSDYMQIIRPVIDAKIQLDTDQWMGWLPETRAKMIIRELEHCIRETIGDPDIDAAEDYRFLKQAALCSYTGTRMQPAYARRFRGMSEDRIEEVMSSFALKNCRINRGLIRVVSGFLEGSLPSET